MMVYFWFAALFYKRREPRKLIRVRPGRIPDYRGLPVPVIDLQLFAAEDEGRTEDPTDRRKREERDKGNVPKSQDLASASVLIGTVVILFIAGTYIFQQIQHMFVHLLGQDFTDWYNIDEAGFRRLAFELVWQTSKIVAPMMLVSVIMAVVGNVSQFGLLFSMRAIEFKPERLIPDFKRVLPVRRNIYNLIKIMFQVAVIGTAAYVVIVDDFIPMLRTADMELKQAVLVFAWVAFKLLLITALILIAIAIPDYFYQRFEYTENLKTTVSESRRERKDEEGDPLMRQRQRERSNDLRRQRNMLQEVPRADVVVTNPTHFAVALQYEPGTAQAPIVVAKGADHLAFMIRTIARENQVPIEENPHLARTLYDEVEVGQEIPDTLYRVVSNVFARLQKFRSGGAGVGA